MKIFIVSLAIIILSMFGLVFFMDYDNVELTEQGVKTLANEAATGAASYFDIAEYGEGHMVINDEEALRHVVHVIGGRNYQYRVHIFDDSLTYRLYDNTSESATMVAFAYSTPAIPYVVSFGEQETEIKEPCVIVEMTRPDDYYRFDFLNKAEVTRATKIVADTRTSIRTVAEGPTGNIIEGLLAYYPFSELATDFSGSNYHGAVNGATLSSGSVGFGYAFDGNDDINMGDVLNMGNSDMAFSLWVKIPQPLPDRLSFLLSKTRDGGGAGRYGIAVDGREGNVGKLSVASSWNGSSYMEYHSSKRLDDNKWHHVVAVFDRGAALSLYVDGRLDSTHRISAHESVDMTSNHPFRIGSGTHRGNVQGLEWFTGGIDTVRVYNRALSFYEVAMLYGEGMSQTLAWYPFGGSANDASGNGAHGTVFGPVVIEGKNGLCYEFDGVDDYIEIPQRLFEVNHTFATWVDISSVTDTQYFIGGLEGAGIGYDGANFLVSVAGGSGSLPFVTEDAFVHLAIKRVSLSGYELYIDGSSIGVLDTKSNASLTARFVGRTSNGHFFDGRVQDVRFYNQWLSNQEIRDLARLFR